MPPVCPHAHVEYRDDYQHCRDCGAERVLINGEWFAVEGWVRIHTAFFEEGAATDGEDNTVRSQVRR